MSKRHKETSEDKWARLMEAYERRFEEEPKQKRRRIIYSSSSSECDEDVQNEEHLELTDDNSKHLENNIPTNLTNEVESVVTESTDSYDPELIKVLGEAEGEIVQYGEDLQGDIANPFQNILVNGLKKETREELIEKYLIPKNVSMAKAPALNPEISAMLVETCRLRDKRLLGKQDQLGRALTALGKAMTALLKKNPDVSKVVATLNDTGKLIADSHYAETDTRRSVITPLIDKSFIDTFKDRKRDSFLFGDKLGDLVNNSKGIKKTSQLIQALTSANTGLNSRGPSSYRARQYRAGTSYYPRRVGGPPATYPQTSRGRGRPLPPPGRRYPPPPPPPPPPHSRRHTTQAHRSTYHRHRN